MKKERNMNKKVTVVGAGFVEQLVPEESLKKILLMLY